tara:strand:+ start:185 stop:1108 length:924 start_codon:yes stop_codon:yes gene_type:complete
MFKDIKKLSFLLNKYQKIFLDDKTDWNLTELELKNSSYNYNKKNINQYYLSLYRDFGPFKKNLFYTKLLPQIFEFNNTNKYTLDKPLIVLCLPRTGSTFISKIFQENNISNPNEKISYQFLEFIRNRNQIYNFCAYLIKKNLKNFSIKWLINFTSPVFQSTKLKIRKDLLKIINKSYVLIINRDLYELSVSNCVARKTKIYHLWNEDLIKKHKVKIQNLVISDDELVSEYNNNKNLYQRYLRFSKTLTNKYTVNFDPFCKDPVNETRKILNWLNVPQPENIVVPAFNPTKTHLHHKLVKRLKFLIKN